MEVETSLGSQHYVFHQLLIMGNTSSLSPQPAVASGRNNDSNAQQPQCQQ